jgi:signal peptidase II
MTEGVAVPEGADRSRTDSRPADSVSPAVVRPSGRAIAVFAAVPVLVVVLDQVVKQLSLTHLAGSAPVKLLGGLVYLNLTHNSGAAYSLGVNMTYIFPVIAVAVIGVILWLVRRLRSIPWGIALGLVVGGALGNLWDRLFRPPGVLRGQVVDMISLFDPAGRVFPPGAIFNIADSALFCGVVLALVLEFTGRRRDGTRTPRETPSDDRAEA